MDTGKELSELREAYIELGQKLGELYASIPGYKTELQEFIAGRIAAVAADHRADQKTDLTTQATAIRDACTEMVERQMATVLAVRQRMIGLEEIAPNLRELAATAAASAVRQYAAAHATELPALVRKEFAALPLASTAGNPAAGLSPISVNVAEIFRGQWTKELQLKRGNLFTFRGSVYLCLRDSSGILPTKQTQSGGDPRYALFTPCGAPGPAADATQIQQLAAAAAVSAAAAAASAAQAASITGCGSGNFGGTVPLIGVNSVTAAATTNLVLNGGSSGASLTLRQGASSYAQFSLPALTAGGIGGLYVAISGDPAATYAAGSQILAPSLATSHVLQSALGVAQSNYNIGYMGFAYAGASSLSNRLTWGFWNADERMHLFPTGNLLLGSTTDMANVGFGFRSVATGSGATATSSTTGQFQLSSGGGTVGMGGGAIFASGSGSFAGSLNLTSDNTRLNFNRSGTSAYSGFSWFTAATEQWFFGMRETGTDSFFIYNTSTAANAVTITRATSAIAFAASISTAAPSGSSAGLWKLGAANAVSPTSPNRTVAIDIGGTVYYLAAKTTND